MTKTSMSAKIARNARSGASVKRGSKAGKFKAMGTAVDGTVIMAPYMKPRQFTVRQIREAVRAVKEEERRKQNSGNLQQPSR